MLAWTLYSSLNKPLLLRLESAVHDKLLHEPYIVNKNLPLGSLTKKNPPRVRGGP